MAARRRATGALIRGKYNPKAALGARFRKSVEGPRMKAKRERREAARGRLPAPGTNAADRIRRNYLPDTEEVRWLKEAERGEILAGGVKHVPSWELGHLSRTERRKREKAARAGSWGQELDDMADRAYRQAYNARQAERGKVKPRRKVPLPGVWIRVKAHKRRRPGKGKK